MCQACGLGWLSPQPSLEEISGYYPPEYYGDTGRKFAGLIEVFVRLVSRRRVALLSRHVRRGGRVLDVGCGRGAILSHLADRGIESHGFEISPQAAQGNDPRVLIRTGPSLESVGYPDRFFDQVIIWHVLEHVPDPGRLMAEVHRILKPGGEALVAVPNFSSWQAHWAKEAWFHLDAPRHLYHFSRTAFRRLLTDAGFDLSSEHHFSLRQNPYGWVQSALNKLKGVPRNSLYELLHNRRTAEPLPFDRRTRFWLKAAFALGMPPALAVEVLAALLRRGATMHIVARSRSNASS